VARDEEEKQNSWIVQSVVKSSRILGVFCAQRSSLSVSDIINATGYPRGTVYRLVRTLESERFLALDPSTGRYQIGPAVTPLLYTLQEPSALVLALHPLLQVFADEISEHAALSIEDGGAPVTIDLAWASANPFRPDTRVGRIDEGVRTANAKVFAAHKPPDQLKMLLAKAQERSTPYTIVDPKKLRAELEKVARDGVAFDDQEQRMGMCGVAAPVWSETGSLVTVVSCAIIVERFTEERRRFLADAIRRCAGEMSAKLSRQSR
jgi:DNA-binding IclR family transcriptional regulator